MHKKNRQKKPRKRQSCLTEMDRLEAMNNRLDAYRKTKRPDSYADRSPYRSPHYVFEQKEGAVEQCLCMSGTVNLACPYLGKEVDSDVDLKIING